MLSTTPIHKTSMHECVMQGSEDRLKKKTCFRFNWCTYSKHLLDLPNILFIVNWCLRSWARYCCYITPFLLFVNNNSSNNSDDYYIYWLLVKKDLYVCRHDRSIAFSFRFITREATNKRTKTLPMIALIILVWSITFVFIPGMFWTQHILPTWKVRLRIRHIW